MARNRLLQVTLYVVAAYLTLFGVLFLLAPGVAERITQTTLPDAKLNLLYGQSTLTFAFVSFLSCTVAARIKSECGMASNALETFVER